MNERIERIRDRILRLGLSQMRVAAAAGVSMMTVHRVINGRVRPHERTMKKIEAVLDSMEANRD